MNRSPVSIDETLAAAFHAFHEGNHEGAVSMFRRLAEDGVADAQHFLGWCYEQGIVVPKDVKETFKWWLLSAEQGVKESQCGLGIFYEEGQVVPRDLVKARQWYSRAAAAGDEMAIDALKRLGATP